MDNEHVLPGPLALPGEPTEAPPGSELKIRILTERAARGEPLFHPLDGLKRAGPAPARTVREIPWWPIQPAPSPPEVAGLPEAAEEVPEGEPDHAAGEAVIPLIGYAGQANSA